MLPDDLSLYIGKKTLVKFILEAFEEPKAPLPRRAAAERVEAKLQPAMMVTLLTYCYATGIYGAVEIQLGIQHDTMIRYICARNYPDLCVIRSFRRYHREVIRQCLTAVMRRVWELRFCGEDAEPIHGAGYLFCSLGRWIDLNSTPDFAREAGQRIERAVRADSMAMDV